jgi:hypothetical protein
MKASKKKMGPVPSEPEKPEKPEVNPGQPAPSVPNTPVGPIEVGEKGGELQTRKIKLDGMKASGNDLRRGILFLW